MADPYRSEIFEAKFVPIKPPFDCMNGQTERPHDLPCIALYEVCLGAHLSLSAVAPQVSEAVQLSDGKTTMCSRIVLQGRQMLTERLSTNFNGFKI